MVLDDGPSDLIRNVLKLPVRRNRGCRRVGAACRSDCRKPGRPHEARSRHTEYRNVGGSLVYDEQVSAGIHGHADGIDDLGLRRTGGGQCTVRVDSVTVYTVADAVSHEV